MEKNAIVTQQGADSFLSIIERAAMSKDIDVAKLEKMLDMQERVMARQSEIEFNLAMTRLQPLLPEIRKTAKAHNTTYAKYEDMERQIRPLYNAEGFSISFTSKRLDDGSEIYYGTLAHEKGHSRTAEICLPPDTSGQKNAIQAKGSTVSYAKRYLVTMLLNIVTVGEDDDGLTGGVDTIDTEAAAELDTRINKLKDAKDYKPKFLKYMKVASLQDIKLRDYLKACNALRSKEKKSDVGP